MDDGRFGAYAGRRCGFWLSRFCEDDAGYVVDTSALDSDDLRLFRGEALPPDCLLVVISPERLMDIKAAAEPHHSEGDMAAAFVAFLCRSDLKLRERIWEANLRRITG